MTQYSDRNKQFDSPQAQTIGHGFKGLMSTGGVDERTEYSTPIVQLLGWGYLDAPPPPVVDERTEYSTSIVQVLGWGYIDSPSAYIVDSTAYIGPPQLSPDYPFTLPSKDIKGRIVDLYLSFDDPAHVVVAPLRLHRFQKSGNTFYIQIKDNNGIDVFNSFNLRYTQDSVMVPGAVYLEKAAATEGDCIYRSSDWSSIYTVLYWETELATLKIIVRNEAIPYDIYPENGDLDARAIYQYPERVRSITIENGDTETVLTRGLVSLRCGYNMDISLGESTAGVRPSSELELKAVAGAGMGSVHVDCDCDTPLTSINGVSPNSDGAFFISTEDCQYVKGVSELNIGNDCTPCCACEDMTELGIRYDAISDSFYCSGGKAMTVRDKFASVVDYMTSLIAAQSSDSSCMVEYMFLPAQCPFAVFKVVVKNVLYTCIQGVRVTIRIPGSIVPYSCKKTESVIRDYSDCYVIEEVPYNPTATGTLTIEFNGVIPPGEKVYASGVIKHSNLEGTVSSEVTGASYFIAVEEDRRDAPICTIIGGSFESPGCVDETPAYKDDGDVSDIEEDIRELCITRDYDIASRRNTTE